MNLKASNVQSAGSADLTAQGQVKISTVTVAEGHNLEWDANNKRQDYTSQEIGSQVVAAGNLKIKAGENLEIRASNVGSSEQLTLQAEKNVTIQAGKTQVQVQENHLNTGKSGGGSKITTRTNQSLQASESIASNLAGKNISITGQNVAVEQGQITAEQELKVQATEQIKIKAGQNSTSSSSQESSRKAGMFSKSSKDVQQTSSQQSLSASTLSGGTVQLQAQETIQIQASNVVGEQDVQLKADKGIVIEAGQEKLVSSSHTQEKKSGLFTSGLNITLGKQSNKNAYQQGETTNLGSVVGSVQGTVDIESQAAVTVQASNIKAGKDLKISGSQVNITDAQAEYSSKEQQESKQSGLSIGLGGGLVSKVQEVAQPLERATQVQDKRLQALYAYKAVDKLQDLKTADTTGRDLKLNISLGTSKSSSNSQSSSASIGVEVGVGGISGVNLAAAKQQGKIKENGTSYTASQITATDRLALESGKDLQVIASQATAEQVQAQVGGNLEIASLQTKESYKEENQGASIGLSAKVKPTGNLGKGAITGGVNQGKINSDYQSVTEQAGIYAGQAGFDIQVGKNTDLKGAVIASEATAEKNKLSTGTLSYSDIDNKAEYQASSMGINVNTSGDAKYNEKGITPAIGIGAEGKAQSTTKAAIAPGTIEVRDNPNQDLSNLSRDTKGSLNQLGKIFDKKTIQERQELAKMFGELAYEQVHKLSVKELKKAQVALAIAQDKKPQDDKKIKELQAQVAAWSEGGSNKIALHSIVGGVMADLGGGNGFAGAVGAGLNEAVQDKLSKTFKNKPDLHQWASAIIGATAAKVVGGNAQTGASTAASGTKNNYLTLDQYEKLLEDCQAVANRGNALAVYYKNREIDAAQEAAWFAEHKNEEPVSVNGRDVYIPQLVGVDINGSKVYLSADGGKIVVDQKVIAPQFLQQALNNYNYKGLPKDKLYYVSTSGNIAGCGVAITLSINSDGDTFQEVKLSYSKGVSAIEFSKISKAIKEFGFSYGDGTMVIKKSLKNMEEQPNVENRHEQINTMTGVGVNFSGNMMSADLSISFAGNGNVILTEGSTASIDGAGIGGGITITSYVRNVEGKEL
ncbi:hemagglutinin repeat-containing protein [Succinispira mobilis]|uniref:hemagglutinin repeat-containing protein n=1 Tax=Succinispira mobilis TaxID=78120 RepID=UPI00037A80D9|nr:hemagglutinin repeat-containing protein [Succinispira mobilis]